MNFIIKPSNKKEKKFLAVIDNNKHIYFGAAGYSDMTQHKNEERKQRYIDRHSKRENWNDPTTAGFYAKNILWNKPTISESIRDTNTRFKNIHISLAR